MKGQPNISAVYRLAAPDTPPDDIEQWGRIERLRRAAWRDAGVIAVSPNELPEPLAGQIKSWAEDAYGKSRKG